MASAWWGGLTDQISSMAKDVLTEGTEEVDGNYFKLALAVALQWPNLHSQLSLFFVLVGPTCKLK